MTKDKPYEERAAGRHYRDPDTGKLSKTPPRKTAAQPTSAPASAQSKPEPEKPASEAKGK